jgi:hypothetical protein
MEFHNTICFQALTPSSARFGIAVSYLIESLLEQYASLEMSIRIANEEFGGIRMPDIDFNCVNLHEITNDLILIESGSFKRASDNSWRFSSETSEYQSNIKGMIYDKTYVLSCDELSLKQLAHDLANFVGRESFNTSEVEKAFQSSWQEYKERFNEAILISLLTEATAISPDQIRLAIRVRYDRSLH